MLPIEEYYIQYNFTPNGRPIIEYIVVHDTGNFKKGANALSHFNFFNSANRSASADYFVDDSHKLKFVRDNDRSWAVGDGQGKYGITNSNSISIEMCVNSDCDFAKTLQNTIELVKYLMKKFNVPIEKVVRHYDASRKNCPQTLNYNNWEGWTMFKNRLQEDTMEEITIEQAKQILKDKFSLSDETIQYLSFYKYGDALIMKLAKG